MKTRRKLIQLLCFLIYVLSSNVMAQWTQGGPYGGNIEGIVMNGSDLFAGTFGSGVFYSNNNGTTWTKRSTGLTNLYVKELKFIGSNLFAGTNNGVFISVDNGLSWNPSGLTGQAVYSLDVISTTLFAGTYTGGVYRSINNGSTWTQVNTGLTDLNVTDLVVSGANLFAATYGGGVYLTANNGTSWTQVNSGLTVLVVNCLTVKGSYLFAGMNNSGGVFRSANNGASWTQVNSGLTYPYGDVFAVSGSNLFVGNYTGLFLSTNDGTSWTQVNSDFNIRELLFSGTNLFAGSYASGLHLSTNNGVSFVEINSGITNVDIRYVGLLGNSMFAGTVNTGTYSSTDNGSSWSLIGTGGLSNQVVTSFASIGSNWFAGTATNGVYRSTNSGGLWTQVNTGLANLYVTTLAVNGSMLFAGTFGGGVFLSTNNGGSWSAVNSGLVNQNIQSLIMHNSNLLTGTNGGGIFLSSDNGSSWVEINTGLNSFNVSKLLRVGSDFFAATYGAGVQRSVDNGNSWMDANTGLGNNYVHGLVSTNNNIFAGTENGAYFSSDYGASWQQINEGLEGVFIFDLFINGGKLFAPINASSVWSRPLSDFLANEPTAQATALTFPAFSTTSLNGSFTSASGNPTGYIVLRRQGSSPTGTPVDGITYSVGNSIGDGVVVGVGSGTSFNDSGLLSNTIYHYDVFAYNGSNESTNYLTTLPLEGSRTTLTTEPSAQASLLGFSLHSTSTVRLNFTAAAGSPTGYLIIRKAGSATSGTPADGTTYSVGGLLDGTIVYIGTSTQLDDSGLASGTTYHYTIFSYNGSGSAINYLSSVSTNTNSSITLPVAPIIQAASSIGQTSFTSNWSLVTGASSHRLDVSIDNFSTFVTGYNSKTVTGTSDVISGLSEATTYQYRVRAVNANGGVSANSSPVGSQLTVPPTPVGLIFTNKEQTQFTISWTASQSATEYLLYVSESASFSPLLVNYGPKTITNTIETVTELTPGNTYHVKVQAKNYGGGPPSPESNPSSQLLKPATPLVNDANPIGTNTFTARWQSANGALSYVLDVSGSSDFSSHLTSYPKDLGNTLEELVIGLAPNTSYYYKVKAVNGTGESPYSNVKPVQTLVATGTEVIIGTTTFSDLGSGQNSVPISVVITGGSGQKTVQLFHKKITSNASHASLNMSNTSGDIYSVNLPATEFDELGVEFFIRASDVTANPPKETSLQFVHRAFSDQTVQIQSIVRFGGTVKSYQIISIPIELGVNNGVDDIFETVPELGSYDKTKWRLVRYQNGQNVDPPTINRIEIGKSYWFNSVNEVTITLPAGVTKFDQSNPFEMQLTQGWNQIATPFPFAIDWDDVLDANNISTGVGNYKIFNSDELDFNESNSLKPYEGGFVFADAATTLTIPVTLKNSANGRKAKSDLSQNIDTESWMLPLTLIQGEVKNNQGGIGMHPQAGASKDQWDDLTMPRFVQYLESNFYHAEFFWPKFCRDIVPTTDEYEWTLSIESNGNGPIELLWDAQAITNAQSNLFLYDEAEGRLVDMKVQSSFVIAERSRKDLKIIFTHEGEYIPNHTLLGKAWPNPASDEANIPVVLSGLTSSYLVEVDVYDLKGVKQKSLGVGEYSAGVHNTLWDIKDANGNDVSNGIYIVKLKVNGRYLPEFSKVIVNRNH